MQRTTRDPFTGRETTLGELRRDITRRDRRCVRCGHLRPEPELFICGPCRDDPDTLREVRNIEEGFTDPVEQRKALMLFGWVGGWWR